MEKSSNNQAQQEMTVEVLELGEMLFDTALDPVTRQPVQGEEADASLVEEMRVAGDEFFTALRLLLEIGQQSTSGDKAASGFPNTGEQSNDKS